MLQQGIIETSSSPWSSCIILVKKKNNQGCDQGWRVCLDYRKLNQITKKDAYPLPRMDDILDLLRGAKYFCTLDLASGYWQVKVAEKDQPKTAFTTF